MTLPSRDGQTAGVMSGYRAETTTGRVANEGRLLPRLVRNAPARSRPGDHRERGEPGALLTTALNGLPQAVVDTAGPWHSSGWTPMGPDGMHHTGARATSTSRPSGDVPGEGLWLTRCAAPAAQDARYPARVGSRSCACTARSNHFSITAGGRRRSRWFREPDWRARARCPSRRALSWRPGVSELDARGDWRTWGGGRRGLGLRSHRSDQGPSLESWAVRRRP
jgi:hypothetical protein